MDRRVECKTKKKLDFLSLLSLDLFDLNLPSLFSLSETPFLKKRLLRHGRSKPNEAGLIVSSLENGIKREHGLSATGREQAREAG